MTGYPLSPGWSRRRLGDIARTQTGGTPSRTRSDFFGGSFPWVKSGELGDGKVRETSEALTQLGIDSSSAKLLPPGTLCIALYGATVGRVGILEIEAATNQAVCGIRLPDGVDTLFLFYYLQSIRGELLNQAKGGAQANISNTLIRDLVVPLPPFSEQKRIVGKIEELFTDLDAGVAALERVRAKLKRYRASVLNAAVTGKLTEAWRQQHPPAETADQLLARILDQRRKQWEFEQLRKFAEADKTPPKGWREKYTSPVLLKEDSLPKLPPGWQWVALDAVAVIVGGITKGQRHDLETHLRSVPYLRVANVQRGRLDLTEIKTIEATEPDIAALRLLKGDILFNEGGDRDKLGRGWVWNDEISDCIHQNHVFRARVVLPDLEPKFISHHGNSFGQLWFQRAGKQSVNLASINMGVLRRFPVPLPPAKEQHIIVAEVERLLSVVEAVEADVEHGLKRAARLRQAILKRAFEGRLVPQDPSDEPAHELPKNHISANEVSRQPNPPVRRKPKKLRAASIGAEGANGDG